MTSTAKSAPPQDASQRLIDKRVWVMAKGFVPDEGGQQTYALQCALAYARKGAIVTVVTQTSAGPRDETYRGLRIVDIGPGKSLRVVSRWIGALRRLRDADSAPHFIHGTTWRTSIAPMLLRLPYAASFHGREFMYVKGAGLRLMTAVARRARPIFLGSQYSATRLVARLADGGLPNVTVHVGLYGTDYVPLARPPRPRGSPVQIMTLCRHEPRKNLLAAVDAAAALRDAGLSFHYVICGRGPDSAAIADRVAALNLADHVNLAGFVSDERVRELYAQSDIFLHPQIAIDNGRDFEGFGLVIADAMRAGCAVVIGEEGGSAQLVEQGVSGIAVDGRDQAALNAAMMMLVRNDDARINMGRAAAIRSRLFDWDLHTDEILDAAGQ